MSTPSHASHLSNDDGQSSRTIALLLKDSGFQPLLPQVLSFLSVIELLYIQQVNHRFYDGVYEAKTDLITRLHLGQFWSRLGVMPTEHFLSLLSGYRAVRELNVSYCHFLTGDTLLALVKGTPSYERIERLNLFYCYNLTDEHVAAVLPLLPNLAELNLGRCIHITDKTLRVLRTSPTLRSLTLSSLPLLSEETLMAFDDPSTLPALAYLSLVNTGKFSAIQVDEVRVSRPQMRIVGPEEQHMPVERNGKRKENRKDMSADT